MIEYIRKRDGRLVPFEQEKIAQAIIKAVQAVGGTDMRKAAEITRQVSGILSVLYKDERVPTVENVQDLVEKILIENGHAQTAKAYILYRKQHDSLRQTKEFMKESIEAIDSYLVKEDWRVNENANMGYSLQGLNNHIAANITSNYWLNKIYPDDVAEAHRQGDFHIHDLGMLSVYCCGWDLKDLLLKGFTGAYGKVQSGPAKHLRTALGQVVNFFYTLQGEAAGAQAFANFDTLLAPFIAYDQLSYAEVQQCLQEFVFNMNVPTRVGFQCLSEDTEILTADGWVGYEEIEIGQLIKTFNIETGEIEEQPVKKVFARHYEGEMYHLKNRIQDQLISPGHRVVRKIFNSDRQFVLEEIEKVAAYKSSVIIPVCGINPRSDDEKISDDHIRLMAWIVADGTKESYSKHRHCQRITIYQSRVRNPANYAEIVSLLDRLELAFSERSSTPALGTSTQMIRLNAEASQSLLDGFWGTRETVKFIPKVLKGLSKRQARLFLETYIKADGHEGHKITTTDVEILNGLQQLAVDAEFGFTVAERSPTIGRKRIFVLRLIDHQDTYIQKIRKVNYSGVIWCPNTVNETVIARRNGKVFITGNTPFTNITMDMMVPSNMANEAVVVGGELQERSYGEFQAEMDLLNRAFCDVMMNGDASGRIFSFPIPTYNITSDLDWESDRLQPVWEMTAKYGIPYFSNFVNSDMDPEDARSMCPISGDEKVLIRSSRGRGVEYSKIRNVFEGNSKQEAYEIYSNGKFVAGKFNKFTDQKMLTVELVNGHKITMTTEHLNFVLKDFESKEEAVLSGKDLSQEMYLPYSLNVFDGEGGSKDLGFFVGAYAGDGSLDGSSVVFSLEDERKKSLIPKLKKIASVHFGAHTSVTPHPTTKLVTLKVHSKAAVGLCRDFIEGKERDKHYRARIFTMSQSFRRGVWDGHYATDGGNRKRIYTSSKKMVETLNMLAATLGTTTSIATDDRPGRYGIAPNHSVLFYQQKRNGYGKSFFKHNGKFWVKIKSVRPAQNTTSYCFEVANDEPVFTVGTTGILTHNCRLRLDNRELRRRGGGLFGSNPLTGSIGVVTVNLPRTAYLAEDMTGFFERISQLMKLAYESLELKRKQLERFTDDGLYPYSKFYLSAIRERSGSFWDNHFSTIGLIGMNEACQNLIGCGIESPAGQDLAQATLKFMRKQLAVFQEETGHLYNLEATPAEGTSFRLASRDRQSYPDIVTAGTDEPYYTNSTQLPVGTTEDIFTALSHQDQLQTLYTGGTVFHGFLGERLEDWRSARLLVKRISENFHLPYFTLSPTFTICPVHGYITGEHFSCPHHNEGRAA